MARTTIPPELVAVNAIQGTLIADNSVTAVHIATNAISGTLVADNAITSTHIAQNNVTATQIAQNTITVTQIADSAVETAKINNDAVTQAKIADDAVGPDQLAANSVVSASIANGTIIEADMADNAVTLAKMASLARGKIIVGDSAGNPSALAIGSNGTALVSDGTDVSWGSAGVAGISSSADATAITIDSSENVGIGGSPGAKLDVNSGSVNTMAHFHSTDDNGFIELKDDNTTAYIGVQNDYMYIGGAASLNAQNLVINDGNGNVGIGTTAPGEELHVSSAVSGQHTRVHITKTGNAGTAGLSMQSKDASAAWTIYQDDNSAGDLNFYDGAAAHVIMKSSGIVQFTDDIQAPLVNGIKSKTFGTASFMIGDSTTGTINAANQNLGIGIDVFEDLTTGDDNTAVGTYAMKQMTSGSQNVAVGLYALQNDTDASFNIAVGYEALNTATNPGNYNTAVGAYALGGAALTTARNTAVGFRALQSCTSGASNTAVGVDCMQSGVVSGSDNVGMGHNALNSLTSGARNVALGRGAFDTVTEGGNNVGIGYFAGDALESGAGNIMIGYNSGVTLSTGSNNILIGQDSASSATGSTNEIVLGNALTSPGANSFAFGRTSEGRVYNSFSTNASWTRDSDERLKTDIQDATLGLNFINNLKTKTFKWKPNNELPETFDAYQEENVRDTSIIMHGMIAQEVKAALDTEGVDTFGGWTKSNTDGCQSISQEMFIHPLIKAVQELKAELDAAKARIATLEG